MSQTQLSFPSTEPVFWSLTPHPHPKSHREAQRSKLHGKTHLYCINHAVDKGAQQGCGGKTSDTLRDPLGEAHSARLSRYAPFCKYRRVKSNSCSTTSHVILHIFHFKNRRLKHIKNKQTNTKIMLIPSS